MKKNRPGIGMVLMRVTTLVMLGVFVFAVSRVVFLMRQRGESQELGQQLVELAVTEKPQVRTAPEEPPRTEEEAPAEQPQERACVHIPISVDFSALQARNEDVRAWIYCPDTPIHYPVLQGTDNRYYLRHMIDGQWNQAGSIFLDYRCAADLSDRYNLIHGHNLRDNQMFGTLPNYEKQAYYDAHRQIYLLTPTAEYVVELFAGFTTDSSDEIYRIPATRKQILALADRCIARSDFYSDIIPQQADRLIVLSTCAYDYDDARYAVIGILRENSDPSGGKETDEKRIDH